MSEYCPDKWVMLKISSRGQTTYKVLATWYGGFADGDRWKLNSGVTKIAEDGQCYLFSGYSGSVYRCHKSTYGMGMYTMGILASFQKDAEEADGVSIELMPEETNFMEICYE